MIRYSNGCGNGRSDKAANSASSRAAVHPASNAARTLAGVNRHTPADPRASLVADAPSTLDTATVGCPDTTAVRSDCRITVHGVSGSNPATRPASSSTVSANSSLSLSWSSAANNCSPQSVTTSPATTPSSSASCTAAVTLSRRWVAS